MTDNLVQPIVDIIPTWAKIDNVMQTVALGGLISYTMPNVTTEQLLTILAVNSATHWLFHSTAARLQP
jgi:hypothetical protein